MQKLVEVLKQLPGVGKKTAERFAFEILGWSEEKTSHFGDVVSQVRKLIRICETCGCLQDDESCGFCSSSKRNGKTLCIVASPKDVFAIEETKEYQGHYFVLGSLLSPLTGRTAETLPLRKILSRLESEKIEEVIIALDSTLEGDATALYLKEALQDRGIILSRLAFGLPMGSTFAYVDGGTLAKALAARNQF